MLIQRFDMRTSNRGHRAEVEHTIVPLEWLKSDARRYQWFNLSLWDAIVPVAHVDRRRWNARKAPAFLLRFVEHDTQLWHWHVFAAPDNDVPPLMSDAFLSGEADSRTEAEVDVLALANAGTLGAIERRKKLAGAAW